MDVYNESSTPSAEAFHHSGNRLVRTMPYMRAIMAAWRDD